LNPFEDRELAARAKVNLEFGAVDHMVVHTLGVLTIDLTARLPVAFKNRPGIVGEGPEQLSSSAARQEQTHQCEYTDGKPAFCGSCHGDSVTRMSGNNPRISPISGHVTYI